MSDCIECGDIKLTGLMKINFLLGKNGCGKSSVLRIIDSKGNTSFVCSRYVSPERAGNLIFSSNIEDLIRRNDSWLKGQRSMNQVGAFKQQTMANWNNLKSSIYRKYHDTRGSSSLLDSIVTSIDSLLEHIQFVVTDDGFKLISGKNVEVPPTNISSGESEIISMAIEVLHFKYLCAENSGLLLLDEPDVHLHPDLQCKFANFLYDQVKDTQIKVIVATHSTSLVSALGSSSDVALSFMKSGDKNISFEKKSAQLESILPIFSAHPLSQIFNEDPVLVLEGEDDLRIWSTSVRSSNGKIKLYPVVAGDVSKVSEVEKLLDRLLPSLYDAPKCYSLRDGDGVAESIGHMNYVKRYRLNCYAAENLLLTDDILTNNNISWDQMKDKISIWLDRNSDHPKVALMKGFKENGYDRIKENLKDLRLIFVDMLGENKPWEVIVGKAIAQNINNNCFPTGKNSLQTYLGISFVNDVLKYPVSQ